MIICSNCYIGFDFKTIKTKKKNHTITCQDMELDTAKAHISHKTHPKCIISKIDQKLYHSLVNITAKTGRKKTIKLIIYFWISFSSSHLITNQQHGLKITLTVLKMDERRVQTKTCASKWRNVQDASLLSWTLVYLVYISNDTHNSSPPHPTIHP